MGQLIKNVVSNCNATSKNKIQTHFAKVIVDGSSEKPYYNIMYFDQTDRECHIGFGSYCLEYVFQWLSEEFEIIEAPTVDAVTVVQVERMIDLTKEECESLIDILELNLFNIIREDSDFDNIECLCNICMAYKKMKAYVDKEKE